MTTTSIEDLFVHNRAWASDMERQRPGFFTGLMGASSASADKPHKWS